MSGINDQSIYTGYFKPHWATVDGYVPEYPIPANRPDLLGIARLDARAIPGIGSMQRYGMAISKPYYAELELYASARLAELKQDILSMISESVLNEIAPNESEDLSGNAYDDKGTPLETPEVDILNIDSPVQLAEILFEKMGIGGGRVLKTTKSGKVAVDKEQLQKLTLEHPIIPKILEYRMFKKALTTYITKLPEVAVLHKATPHSRCHLCGRKHYEDVWRIHTTLLTTRAATGRLASKSPNLQNIPARTELGRMIRAGFIAELGYLIAQSDLSQAELRLLGHRANEAKIKEIYRQQLDIHTETARVAFGLTDIKDVTKDQRDPCKNVNFGVVYGLSAEGLYDLMVLTYAVARKPLPDWVTIAWCEDFIQRWFGIFPGVHGYLSMEHSRAYKHGCVHTEYGRIRPIPEVFSVFKHIRRAGERQAGNAGIQGTCADIMRVIIAVLDTYFNIYQRSILQESELSYLLMSIHDEVLTEVPEDRVEQTLKTQIQLIEGTAEFWSTIPMLADGKVLEYWKK
jgi:DNA polymerase-1